MGDKLSLLKDIWQKMSVNYKRFFVILMVVLIISTFFTIYYFSDGLEELINMSRHVVPEQ